LSEVTDNRLLFRAISCTAGSKWQAINLPVQ
jgi:hypothetical protein